MEIKVIKGVGPKRPKLILIGEAPGEEENNQGLPFVGPSGHIQDGILSSAGLLRQDCFLDNVVPIRPPMNEMKRLSELGATVEMFIPNLTQTLLSLDCPIIIAYGDVAMWYLTGMGEVSKKGEISGISKHRGSIYPCILDPRKLVVPTFHPRFVIENWKMRGVVVEDVKKAIRVGKGGRKNVKFNTKIGPSRSEVETFIRQLKEADRISLDIETVGSGQVACVGIGTNSTIFGGRASLCIPFKFGYNNYWDDQDEFHIWSLLRDLLQGDQLKIGQNLNYDFTKLLPFIGEPAPPWYDLMVAFHLLEPELPHTLAFMVSMFTDGNYYKDDPKDEEKSWKYTTSSERLWEYNGKDVEYPLIIEPILTKELKEIGMLSRFYGFDMPKMRVMWRVQQRGILVDDEMRVELLVKEIAGVGSLKTQLKDIVGYDLNPLSPKQMMKFLYEDLKLPPQRHRKTKKLTADKEAIDRLFGRYPRPEFALALEIRDKIKDIGTYLASKDKETGEYSLTKVDDDGRMRSRYNVCGTATGRTSSKKTYDDTGIDAQNIPESLREMFIAPEGKVLQVFDLWQAEAFVVAILSQCQSFLQKLRNGEKIHKMVASWILNKPEDQIDNNNQFGGEYWLGKRTVHASNYGLGWNTFMTFTNSGIGKYNKDHPEALKPFISAAEAKRILLVYETFAPEIKMWHQEVISELQRTRMLVTPFGRKRLFRSYRGQADNDTPRKAFAHTPQSTIAEYAHQAIIKLEYLLPQGNEIIQEGFDAFIIEANESDVDENERLVRFACDKELMWKGEKFKIPVEQAGVNRRWIK